MNHYYLVNKTPLILSKHIKGALPLFLLMFFIACKSDLKEVGVGLRPDGGIIGNQLVDTLSFSTRTIEEDSVRTDSLSLNILGATNDPLFGTSEATLHLQFLLEEFNIDFTSAVLDSIVLTLKYQATQSIEGTQLTLAHGNLSSPMSLEVLKLAQAIPLEDRYYSNQTIATGTSVGTWNGLFEIQDSVEVVEGTDSFKVAPHLRIRLDDFFGNEFLTQPSTVFADQTSFLAFLEGLAIVPSMASSLSPGNGAFVGFDLVDDLNAVTIYYNGSESKRLVISNESEYFSTYKFYGQPASITNQKSTPGSYSKTYMQSLGGAKVKIDIPALSSFLINEGDVVINEAELRVKVDPTSIMAGYNTPYRALLFQPDEFDSTNAVIQDFIDDVLPPSTFLSGRTNYGGRLDTVNNEYVFHFNRHLQELVQDYSNGVDNNRGFYLLIPSDFPGIPSRAVLDTDTATGGIELNVRYTKLN